MAQASPTLVIQFLNLSTNTFKVATAESLQLRQIEDGVAALGISETVPKLAEDGTPLVGETQTVFTPLVNYAINLVKPEETPKVELATQMPKRARKAKVQ